MKIRIILFSCFVLSMNLATQNAYYPLEKGKVWIYDYEPMFSNNSDQQSRIEVLEETKSIDGKEYMIIQTSMGTAKNFDVIQKSYVRYGDNGSVMAMDENSGKESMVFPGQPLTVGKTWTVIQAGNEATAKIIEDNVVLNTSGKTFKDCLVIESTQNNTKVRSYVKKNIGMVAIGIFMDGEEKIMQYLVDE